MRWAAISLVACALAACGDDIEYRFAGLTQVTGGTPLPMDCNGASQTGIDVANTEAEPSIAIDPTDARHFVAAWQQDRWSNGGADGIVSAASFDGGHSWEPSIPHFSRCAGGDVLNGGGYDRSTDPWVSIGPDGDVYLLVLAFDNSTARNAVLAARSSDGGRTWTEPATLIADDDPDVFNDKDSITADPTVPGRAYATWDRLTGQTMPTKPVGTGPTMLAIFDGGAWGAAAPIYDPGVDAQTIGNIVAVTPDGTLIDVFDRITMSSAPEPVSEVDVIRSTDHGATWSDPITVGAIDERGVQDPTTGVYVRSGELPAIAADPASDAVYVVSEIAFGGVDGAGLWASLDGGSTWSAAPVQVNPLPGTAAFTPVVAVGSDGAVGVTYYDTRDTDPTDTAHFDVAAFLATSRDHGATWTEERLTGAFDLRPVLIGDVYFLGDYEGLAASGAAMVPFFAAGMTTEDPSDLFVRALGG